MTLVEVRLVNAYAILVLAAKRTLDQVPDTLKSEIEIRIAEIEVEKLEKRN